MRACTQPWAMFVPVDVPLVPGELLRRWAEATIQGPQPDEYGMEKMYDSTCLASLGIGEPAFVMARPRQGHAYSAALDRGVRRLNAIFDDLQREYTKGNAILEAAAFAPLQRPTRADMDFGRKHGLQSFETALAADGANGILG